MRTVQMLSAVGLAVFGLGLGIYGFRPTTGVAQAPAAAATVGPKFTVIEGDGTNLLVVDNSTNMMHFYTIDPEKLVGEELKLRGSLDLNQVGQKTLKPIVHKHE